MFMSLYPKTLYVFGSAGACNLAHQQRRGLSAQLDCLTEHVQRVVPICKSVFLEGEATGLISALARDVDADLIVTASHHPTFLGRLLNLDKAPQICIGVRVRFWFTTRKTRKPFLDKGDESKQIRCEIGEPVAIERES
jgi:hypothetical protein